MSTVRAATLKEVIVLVAGHLQEKNGYYYVVLNYKEAGTGKRRQPWFPTGLPVKGNKKKAEKMMMEIRQNFQPPKPEFSSTSPGELSPDMLFSDFLLSWLAVVKGTNALTTYSSYKRAVDAHIEPYFRQLGVTIAGLEPRQIQSYYLNRLQNVSGSSVRREHAVIHRSLEYAVMMDLIPYNPSDKTQPPKNNDFSAHFYNADQLEKLFEVTKDHKMGLLFQIAAFYGMRRGEILGLKWEAIDFENDVIHIRHTVTQTNVDGKLTLIQVDRTKNRASRRTLPLVPVFKERLLTLKAKQEENQRICGNSYNKEFLGYVFVDEMGNLFKPNNVSTTFKKLLENNGLPIIRFHDLRHSCATLLVHSGTPINNVSEWVGHSDVTTTMKFYAHLDGSSKQFSADKMKEALKIPEPGRIPSWQ